MDEFETYYVKGETLNKWLKCDDFHGDLYKMTIKEAEKEKEDDSKDRLHEAGDKLPGEVLL